MMQSINHVTIVDSDASCSMAIRSILEAEGFLVSSFVSADDLLADPQPLPRGCVLYCLSSIEQNVLQLVVELQRQLVGQPIVVVADGANIAMVVELMRMGVVDFLEKPAARNALVSSVQRALEAEANNHERNAILEELRERLSRVSKREMQVFERVVAGLTNKAIATQLEISERTVEVHRAQVMHKMNADSLAELIKMRMTLEVVHADDMYKCMSIVSTAAGRW